ncbi:hypothetical protein BC834DRAFT_972970 [Gloeopeniophorella convolvens]|nr:hypothetical protein BC834DRAFT_972970 [Gloeopeniophorella convolvens]
MSKLYPDRPSKTVYLPHFLASVVANPSIDVLFAKFDKYGLDHVSTSPKPPSLEMTRHAHPGSFW